MSKSTQAASTAQRNIGDVQTLVNEARLKYVQAGGQDRYVSPRALREFHSAVIGYYMALRPHRKHDDVSEIWETAEIADSSDAVAIVDGSLQETTVETGGADGLDALADWIGAETTVETSLNRANGATKVQQAPVVLSGQALLRASSVLDDVAEKLGFGARDAGKGVPGEIEIEIEDDGV
jgi:hypothetical protein